MIFEIIDIFKKMMYTGFTTMIPIAFFYVVFFYLLLNGNAKRANYK